MMKLARFALGVVYSRHVFSTLVRPLLTLTSQRGQFLQEATFNYVWLKMCECVCVNVCVSMCVLLIPNRYGRYGQ